MAMIEMECALVAELELVVAAVAEYGIGAVLAAAEVNGLGFGDLEFYRRHAAAFVAAVAEWLLGALAAGTPEVALAGFDFHGIRTFLSDDWFCHGESP
jgi:FtsZ-interacting cell division protein ZipA